LIRRRATCLDLRLHWSAVGPHVWTSGYIDWLSWVPAVRRRLCPCAWPPRLCQRPTTCMAVPHMTLAHVALRHTHGSCCTWPTR